MSDRTAADAARATAERYFDALNRFDMEALLSCFTPDATYSHPPFDPTQRERDEVVGHEAIERLVREKRGPRPMSATIDECVVSGDVCYLEGRTGSAPVVASFLASVRLDDSGRFRSYVAYGSSPPAGAGWPRDRPSAD